MSFSYIKCLPKSILEVSLLKFVSRNYEFLIIKSEKSPVWITYCPGSFDPIMIFIRPVKICHTFKYTWSISWQCFCDILKIITGLSYNKKNPLAEILISIKFRKLSFLSEWRLLSQCFYNSFFCIIIILLKFSRRQLTDNYDKDFQQNRAKI